MHTKATLKIVFPLFLTASNFTAILPHESWVFLNQPTLVSYLVRCIILSMLLSFICGKFLFLNFQQVSRVQNLPLSLTLGCQKLQSLKWYLRTVKWNLGFIKWSCLIRWDCLNRFPAAKSRISITISQTIRDTGK